MWGSKIGRDTLLLKISLLATLGPIRDGYTERDLIVRRTNSHLLSIEQEREIVMNLAFLSSRRKDSKMCVALCVEEHADGGGMTIRFSVNGEKGDYIKEGLQNICSILEQSSKRGAMNPHSFEEFLIFPVEGPEAQEVTQLFDKVVRQALPRISNRLRLSKRYPVNTSPFVTALAILSSAKRSVREALERHLQEMVDHYRILKALPLPGSDTQVIAHVNAIIRLCYKIRSGPETSRTLVSWMENNSTRLEPFNDVTGKLCQYYKSTMELVKAARHQRFNLFGRLRVEEFLLPMPTCIREPTCHDTALDFMRTLRVSTDCGPLLAQGLQKSDLKVAKALARRLDVTRAAIKVHAELKLLFYYETHSTNSAPRVICASKSACYLCDLFFRLHGRFQIPATFGKLNERWILPDWMTGLTADRCIGLATVVEAFDLELDRQLHGLTQTMRRLPDPRESSVGISAHWSLSDMRVNQTLRTDGKGFDSISPTASCPDDLTCSEPPSMSDKGYVPRRVGGCSSSVDVVRGSKQLDLNQASEHRSCIELPLSDSIRPSKWDCMPGFQEGLDCMFHDVNILLEVEDGQPATYSVTRCPQPKILHRAVVVDIDDLEKGKELSIELSGGRREDAHIYLVRHHPESIHSWWMIYRRVRV